MNPDFSAHGLLFITLASFFAAYVGWKIGEREGDERGWLGFLLGGVTFAACLLWLFHV